MISIQKTLNTKADRLVELSSAILESMLHYTGPGDEDLQKMVGQDAADILMISEVLRAGEVKKAYSKMCHLDTAVRERIPDSIWDWCQEIYENEEEL